MTIPVSTVPAAIRYISTAIQAQLSAANEGAVDLVVGTPGPNLPNTMIQVASAVRRTPDPSAFVGGGGRNFLEEKYTIDVTVSVAGPAQTFVTGPLGLSDRAWQLVAYVETAVRTDPSLGTLVNIAFPSRTTGGKPTTDGGSVPSRVVTLVVTIHCENLD